MTFVSYITARDKSNRCNNAIEVTYDYTSAVVAKEDRVFGRLQSNLSPSIVDVFSTLKYSCGRIRFYLS